ncbi:hypothetical protein ACHAXM_008549 [Skeletonema potamos]
MSSDEVIELSVEETQALRAKLGLAPLRVQGSGGGGGGRSPQRQNPNDDGVRRINNNDGGDGEILSLSIEETNALRLKIGLPPLNTTDSSTSAASKQEEKGKGMSSSIIHAPPTNTTAIKEAQQRMEDAQAKRHVRERLQRLEEENNKYYNTYSNHDEGEESTLNFAARMMRMKQDNRDNTSDKMKAATTEEDNTTRQKKKKKTKNKTIQNAQLSIPTTDDDDEEDEQPPQYTSADLQGIQVSHSTSEFISGSTTILTLADNSILQLDPNSKKVVGLMMDTKKDDDNDTANVLINVNMNDDTNALENLKRKRQIELGMGRAGGYAGYDDDEFEELGGGVVGVVSATAAAAGGSGGGFKQKSRGFAIGANGTTTQSSTYDQNNNNNTDLFSSKPISLESRYGSTTIASDFMSYEDDEKMMMMMNHPNNNSIRSSSKEEQLEKERAKHMKLLEKMRRKNKKMIKKDNKKRKKKNRRVQSEEDSEDDEDGGERNLGGNSLMASLEATAVDVTSDEIGRKRRRNDNDDGCIEVEKSTLDDDGNMADHEEIAAKKNRFDQIMQKGKMRTERAFQKSAEIIDDEDNADEDDAFLNAALAKARRLKRLKDMNGGATSKSVKGEDAVVSAVERIKQEEASSANNTANDNGTKSTSGGLTFEFDEMQEFTRALRAREDQAKRVAPVRSRGVQLTTNKKKEVVVKKEETDDDAAVEPAVEDVDMEEMAKEMKADDNDNNNNEEGNNQAFGSTAENNGVGRGMSGFLSLLKQTGEIKNSGKEEMRGRAKDKRTYEDYDSLDLKKVVKIDSRNAQEKDIEFANREIKLEYRDDHGRLLTRKEAYRNMCYQFHGHGSSKKNEERRQRQIEREREENKLASRQVMAEGGVGTLGALKATQKATGKAFIVHKM